MDIKAKEAKIIEKNQILKGIKDGTLERFTFTAGYSIAWKKFVKIRNAENMTLCSYVQCSECKVLLYFKEGSGTSHLNRHKCDENETEGPAYKILPSDKITSIKESITQNIIKYCATDFVPIEMSSGHGFKSFLQWFVTLASKYGNINVDDIFPSENAIDRHIKNFKDDSLRKILENFREAITNECCSASLEVIGSGGSNNIVVTMSLHYFDKNLILSKKIIFTMNVDKRKAEDLVHNVIHNFNIFGGEENDIHRLTIVTPNMNLFKKALESPFSRIDCVADKINQILSESFEQSSTKGFEELLSNCRNIFRFINDKKVKPLNICVLQDDGTWKGKIVMLKSLVEQYDDIMELLDNENKANIKINKRNAEEFLQFLEPFMDAVSDLSETSYPTANKILLWWAILNDHLKTSESYSLELKKIMINARLFLATNFEPTIDEKINCFLDPRYKYLKMVSDSDRAEVISTVQTMLKNMEELTNNAVANAESSGQGPPNKKSRSSDYEASKSDVNQYRSSNKPKPKDKVDRFKKYETTPSDETINDELDIYLKLPPTKSNDFESEVDVLKCFWKSNKNKLPKLFKLVKTRLHLPACCTSTRIQLKTKLDLKDLDDFMFIRSNMCDI